MANSQELIELTKQYFSQQAELYGKLIYVEGALSSGGPRKDSAVDVSSLDALHSNIRDCQKCRLANGRTKVVFGAGNPQAKLVCIGEGPGYEEDQRGEPFVGNAGDLLNKILKAVGFAREEVFITNIVKCRPPENRDPAPDEAEQCKSYLEKQIELVQPAMILALGRIAAHYLLDTEDSLSKLRTRDGLKYRDIPVFVTYHPAALLRHEGWKRDTWRDVQRMRVAYDRLVGDKPAFERKNTARHES